MHSWPSSAFFEDNKSFMSACRDLDVQLKMQQVHVTPMSQQLACQRNAVGYKNYGERLYVEGRLEAMRKEKEVSCRVPAWPSPQS